MRRKDRAVTELIELEGIIQNCKTCHLAMVDEGEPYVVPLSFGYEIIDNRLTLYFHSAKEGRKLDILRKNSKVSFDMAYEGTPIPTESPCNSGYYFSSVMGSGSIEFLEEAAEKCKALSLLMKHQTGRDVVFKQEQADSVCVYKLSTTDFTGKMKKEI